MKERKKIPPKKRKGKRTSLDSSASYIRLRAWCITLTRSLFVLSGLTGSAEWSESAQDEEPNRLEVEEAQVPLSEV